MPGSQFYQQLRRRSTASMSRIQPWRKREQKEQPFRAEPRPRQLRIHVLKRRRCSC